MLILLAVTAQQQLSRVHDDLEQVVQRNNVKIESTATMRDSIRQRAIILRNARLSDDPFERDELSLLFSTQAKAYRIARDNLIATGLDAREMLLNRQLADKTRMAQPVNDKAMQLLVIGADDIEISKAVTAAATLQNDILKTLDELAELEKRYAKSALIAGREDFAKARQIMILIITLIVVVSLLIAVTVVKKSAQSTKIIQHQASHDALTGLFNRREFERRLNDLVERAISHKQTHVLVYLDLDDFKLVNDNSGHPAGDQLLLELSDMLKKHVRHEDVLARLGGDEFGVLLKYCDVSSGKKIAEKIKDRITEYRLHWGDEVFGIGASIGIVAIDESSIDADQLMKEADSACYAAKDQGRNRIYIYQKDDAALVKHNSEVNWAGKIKSALDDDAFALYAQPVTAVDSPDAEWSYLEILIRMKREGKPILPEIFLSSAERFHQITDIDLWVVNQIFELLSGNRQLIEGERMIGINLSGISMGDQKFIDELDHRLNADKEVAKHICFEITETVAIRNLHQTRSFIKTLKRHGCKLALDDFGVGMSSYTYLKHLDVDFVKIDGEFIRDIGSDDFDRELVRLINNFCHTVGMKTIAEYVCTKEIEEIVRNIGVDYLQGYHIGRPAPLEEFYSLPKRSLAATK